MKVTEKEEAKKQDSTTGVGEKGDKKETTKEVKEVKDADTLTFEGLSNFLFFQKNNIL